MNIEIKYHLSLDPILTKTKAIRNRTNYINLRNNGHLYFIVDCFHPIFDKKERKIEQGDIIQSTNDGVIYVVTYSFKTDCGLTRSFLYQPLFCIENMWNGFNGILNCIKIDGYSNPFVK